MDDALDTTTDETAALRNAPDGTRVLGADGGKLGEIVAVYRDRLIVERGFFFPTDYYVPFAAVGEYMGGTVRLIVSLREALEFGWETPPEDEVAPSVAHESQAGPSVPGEQVAPAEPPPSTVAEEPVAPAHTAARPPVIAEQPAPPAESTGETSQPEDPHPAAASPSEAHRDATIPTAEPEASTAEEPASPESAASATEKAPAADRPKPVSPLIASAGSSTLSRLFPDLVVGSSSETPGPVTEATASTDATIAAEPALEPDSTTSSPPLATPEASAEPPVAAEPPDDAAPDGTPTAEHSADDQPVEQSGEGDARKRNPVEE